MASLPSRSGDRVVSPSVNIPGNNFLLSEKANRVVKVVYAIGALVILSAIAVGVCIGVSHFGTTPLMAEEISRLLLITSLVVGILSLSGGLILKHRIVKAEENARISRENEHREGVRDEVVSGGVQSQNVSVSRSGNDLDAEPVEFLLEKGVPVEFFHQYTPEQIANVLKWRLKPQEPIQEFLNCVNQYDTVQEALAAWATKSDKATVEQWGKLPERRAGNSYSVNAENFQKMVSVYGSQEIFNIGMETTIEIARDGIENKGWNFDALIHFCAFRRSMIAKWQGNRDHNLYGVPRGGPLRWAESEEKEMLTTQLYGPYECLKGVFQDLELQQFGIPRGFRASDITWEDWSKIDRSLLELPHPMPEFFTAKSQERPSIAFYMKVMGQPIELSSLHFFSRYEQVLYHTPARFIDILYNKSKDVYENALGENEPAGLMPQLGKLFWIICQGKLWWKGDPAIAEMMIRTILLTKGWKAPGWKAGIIPWVEVSKCVNGEEFGRNFATLFNGEIIRQER